MLINAYKPTLCDCFTRSQQRASVMQNCFQVRAQFSHVISAIRLHWRTKFHVTSEASFPFSLRCSSASDAAFKCKLHSTCVSLFFPHRKLRKLASPELCVWTCENTLVHWKIAKIEPQDGFMFKNGEWFGLFLLFNVKLRNQKMVDISSDEPLCTSFFLNTSLLLCHCSRARVFREFPFSHECHNTGSLKD